MGKSRNESLVEGEVNFSVLRELECKMTLCDRNVLE